MKLFMRLQMRTHAVLHYWRRIRATSHFGIPPDALVLDIGSGQDPHPRANVLCDRFLLDSAERALEAPIVADRPLVVADAASTPFADKTFDFVFCSHLLEHVEDPAAVLRELQRIARAGYIETPSVVYEKLWGWKFHRWFVDVRDGELYFQPKDTSVFDRDLHEWFGSNMEEPPFWRFFMRRLHDLDLMSRLVWRDKIPFSVAGPAVADATDFVAATEEIAATVEAASGLSQTSTAGAWAKRRIGRVLRRKSDKSLTRALQGLRCVSCRAPVEPTDGGWSCRACGVSYPQIGLVHVFLANRDLHAGTPRRSGTTSPE